MSKQLNYHTETMSQNQCVLVADLGHVPLFGATCDSAYIEQSPKNMEVNYQPFY